VSSAKASDWNVEIFHTPKHITVQALVPNTLKNATLNADPYNEWTANELSQAYKIDDIPKTAQVWRICRVLARPRHEGGGTAVMQAYCAVADQNEYWTILEASPYPEQDRSELIAFYNKYGFIGPNGLMYRNPRRHAKKTQ
jgi:hypothetical protein